MSTREIDKSWLVCPFGQAPRAVVLAQYLDEPGVFDRMRSLEREACSQVGRPAARAWGIRFLGVAAVCAIAGRLVGSFLQNQLNGKPFGFVHLLVFGPYWTFGVLGVITWIYGYLVEQRQIKKAAAAARRRVVEEFGSEDAALPY